MSRIHDALTRAQHLKAERPPDQTRETEVERAIPGNTELETLHSKASAVIDDEYQAEIEPPPTETAQVPAETFRVGLWSPDPTRFLFSTHGSHASAKEEFRSLRARFYQILAARPLKVALVSSALPKEGKSFVSANLAEVLSRHSGRSTLLIDGDLRKSQLHDILGGASTPGLTDYLQNENLNEQDVVQRGDTSGLFFLPCGTESPNASELLSSPKMKRLMQWAREKFSWVIIDSPPVVIVSDAVRLAEFCDGVVLVVCAETTPYETAAKAKSLFRQDTVLGVVLNRVPNRNRETTRYHYSGYYGEESK
jgi:protein-tyrosine kinase